MLDVLHCVLIDSPEALNMMRVSNEYWTKELLQFRLYAASVQKTSFIMRCVAIKCLKNFYMKLKNLELLLTIVQIYKIKFLGHLIDQA